MRTRCAWWSALAVLTLSACSLGDWGAENEPQAADCAEGAERCQDDASALDCTHYTDGDYNYWRPAPCPGTSVCRDEVGTCVLPGVQCDPRAASTCVNGAIYACADGMVLARRRTECTGDAACTSVPASSMVTRAPGADTAAVCTIDPSPCKPFVDSECRDGAVYECSPQGYPVSRVDCPVDAPCTEGTLATETFPVAQCNPEFACPPAGKTECANGKVYRCEGELRISVENCAEFSCFDVGGFGACYRSPTGPEELEWQPIPGGSFAVGSPQSGAEREQVTLEPFEMLRTEVTRGQFMRCVAAGMCDAGSVPRFSGEPSGDLPAVLVDAVQAKAFCLSVGGALPTELEWEFAARNAGEDVSYPGGDAAATCSRAVVRNAVANDDHPDPACAKSFLPGCSRTPDITAEGVCDLVGNASEWVLEIPDVPGKTAVRGANAFTDPTYGDGVTIFDEQLSADNGASTSTGFRCVRHPVAGP